MSEWTLRFLGVGNAAAVQLGSAMACIERDGQPWLAIDCGGEGLTAFLQRYGEPPRAIFVTHTHLDHVAGFERVFVDSYFDRDWRGKVRVYAPAPLIPLLHARVGDYPNALAEGGANFWDAFHVIPVGGSFWHDTAFGLRLRGSMVWTGDTRPIPEVLAAFASDGELIAHDCALHGNPSHTGVEDLEREYPRELLDRCTLYHYASDADGDALRARGHRVARPGDGIELPTPTAVQQPAPGFDANP